MTRSILCGLMAVLSVGAVGAIPLACQSGGIGDPCTPEDEYSVTFSGFKVAEENIESRSFQCQTRLCLVNHFQGRVSCPAGQGTPKGCNGTNDTTTCGSDGACVLSQTYAPSCTPCDPNDPTCVDTCLGLGLQEPCDPTFNYCGCKTSQSISGVSFACEPATAAVSSSAPQVLNAYVCHKAGNCQTLSDTVATGKGKDCCIPGTDSPVAVAVCGQCNDTSKRDAQQAVYCTSRCCAPCCPACNDNSGNLCEPSTDDPSNPSCSTDTSTCGPACDPNFNYVSCPSGYSCTTIRTNVGLGDAQLAGAYCIKSGTAFLSTSAAMCGAGAQGGFVADMSCSP
jgi:hypothetical protein